MISRRWAPSETLAPRENKWFEREHSGSIDPAARQSSVMALPHLGTFHWMQEWAEPGVEAGGEGWAGLALALSSLPLPVIVMPLKWVNRWVTEGEGNYFCVTDTNVEKHRLSPSGVSCRPQAPFSNAGKKKKKKNLEFEMVI